MGNVQTCPRIDNCVLGVVTEVQDCCNALEGGARNYETTFDEIIPQTRGINLRARQQTVNFPSPKRYRIRDSSKEKRRLKDLLQHQPQYVIEGIEQTLKCSKQLSNKLSYNQEAISQSIEKIRGDALFRRQQSCLNLKGKIH